MKNKFVIFININTDNGSQRLYVSEFSTLKYIHFTPFPIASKIFFCEKVVNKEIERLSIYGYNIDYVKFIDFIDWTKKECK